MPKPSSTRSVVLIVQILVAGVALASWQIRAASSHPLKPTAASVRSASPVSRPPRTTPLVIEPLYDDADVVSLEELAGVLAKIRPVFPPRRLKPNFVEHALRAWGVQAKFADPRAMSGEELKNFLTDHSCFLASWGDDIQPLLEDRDDGVAVRWGKEEGGSVHHDHWLASLTEAGVALDEPVFTPSQQRPETIADVLQQSLADFRVDETETEWSALAFGLWLPPQKDWYDRSGRHVSFDLLAARLMRGHKRFGVCSGTHRVYSLMVLIRLDDDYRILSDSTRSAVMDHLRGVRDLIMVSQFPDGHWPSNWSAGADAVRHPIDDELFKQVIATGHHLEWLAIAPEELHPPREQIRQAAAWVIRVTLSQTADEIQQRYTFFSHVGNALALWRKTHPTEFWLAWHADRPEPPIEEPTAAKKKGSETPSAEH